MIGEDEFVFLSIGPAYDDGDVVRLSELPNDALPTAVRIEVTVAEGEEPRFIPVYSVER